MVLRFDGVNEYDGIALGVVGGRGIVDDLDALDVLRIDDEDRSESGEYGYISPDDVYRIYHESKFPFQERSQQGYLSLLSICQS